MFCIFNSFSTPFNQVELWKSKLSKTEQNNGKTVLGAATKPTEPKTDCILMKAEAPAAEEKKKDDAPKKEKKPKAEKTPKKAAAADDEAPVDIGRLDLRVGHIRFEFRRSLIVFFKLAFFLAGQPRNTLMLTRSMLKRLM